MALSPTPDRRTAETLCGLHQWLIMLTVYEFLTTMVLHAAPAACFLILIAVEKIRPVLLSDF